MAPVRPQNPVFAVEPGVLTLCLPKVACQKCGTVFSVRIRGEVTVSACPECATLYRVPIVPGPEPPSSGG